MTRPWLPLVAGVAIGVFSVWFFAPRPGPDLTGLDALKDSVAAAYARTRADSIRLAAVDDTLTAYRDTVATVTANARLIASAARRTATEAEADVRAVLDSLGASTAALDTMAAAHAREIEAKDAEIAARDRERAILWRRVEASDTLIGSLLVEIDRWQAVGAEETRIRERLQGQLRGAKIRERVAEAVAVGALVWTVVS